MWSRVKGGGQVSDYPQIGFISIFIFSRVMERNIETLVRYHTSEFLQGFRVYSSKGGGTIHSGVLCIFRKGKGYNTITYKGLERRRGVEYSVKGGGMYCTVCLAPV